MKPGLAQIDESVVVVVDLQPSFMTGILDSDRVLHRSKFLLKCANMLGVPSIGTEQSPERMGGLEPEIESLLRMKPIAKRSFSCCSEDAFPNALGGLKKDQAILIGIETNICVSQTAHHLLDQGYQVFLAEDAAAARSSRAHETALRRLRHAGVIVTDTEAIVYEWMNTSSHEKFRDVLEFVKEYAGGNRPLANKD